MAGVGTICIVPHMSEQTAGNSRSDHPVLDTKGAAAYLNCTPLTIRHMVRDGRLPAARVGSNLRYRRADLDNLFTATGGGQ
jgi:excisionase family DNA binding protein